MRSSNPLTPNNGGTLGGEFWLWALAPWPAVGAGLYIFHSALLAFAFYATVCLLGAARMRAFGHKLRLKWPLGVHLGIALASNLALVGLYLWLGKYLLPVDKLRASLSGIGVTRASFVWLFPYFLIGNPLVEEYSWRAGVAKQCGFGPVSSSISGVLFGAWHSLPIFLICPWWVGILAVLGVMAIGFALAEIVDVSGTLGDAVLLHSLAADLPLLVILWIAL